MENIILRNIEKLKILDRQLIVFKRKCVKKNDIIEPIRTELTITKNRRVVYFMSANTNLEEQFPHIIIFGKSINFIDIFVNWQNIKKLLNEISIDYVKTSRILGKLHNVFKNLPHTYDKTIIDGIQKEMTEFDMAYIPYYESLNGESYDPFFLNEEIKELSQNLSKLEKDNEVLLNEYKVIQTQKRRYLPPLHELFIVDVLFVIQHLHGGVVYKDKKIKHTIIPRRLQLYRAMATTFGYPGLCQYNDFVRLKDTMTEIIRGLHINRKMETIKSIIQLSHRESVCRHQKHVENITPHVRNPKHDKLTNEQLAKCSTPHVRHFLSGHRIVSKSYTMNLVESPDKRHDGMIVINPKFDYSFDLMDYMDLPLNQDYTINVDLEILLNLIKRSSIGMKDPILVFLDYSCSIGHILLETTNKIEKNALNIEEGTSISNRGNSYVPEIPNLNRLNRLNKNVRNKSKSKSRARARSSSMSKTRKVKSVPL